VQRMGPDGDPLGVAAQTEVATVAKEHE
jgi:hypothetical protein